MLLALLLLVMACQHEELDTSSGNYGYVEFLFTKHGNVSTRADIAEDGSGAFVDGDRIGLYIEQKTGTYWHIILTRENGTWMPRLKKSDLGDGLVTLNAYYPARDDIQDEITDGIHKHPVSADQQAEGYGTSDLLWSHKTVSAGAIPGNRIEMPFEHALHRLVVNIESKEGELPEDLTVSVRGRTQGTAYLFTGQVAPAEDSETEWIKARNLGEGHYYAVFYPQKLKQGEEWVKLSTSGKESVYKSPATVGGSSSLEAGRQTTLRLTLKQNGTVNPDPDPSEWANSKHWLYGISADTPFFPDNIEDAKEYFVGSPEKFPDGEWFRIPNTEVQYLNYNSSYGWYDCDKDNPEERGTYEGYKDWYMCWAATASNLLHWWMYHNRPYIEAYDQRYGAELYSEYPRPSMKFSDTEGSKLFDFFRDIFLNIGNWDAAAVNWFVRGEPINLRPDTNGPYYDFYHSFGGYFRQVFNGQTLARTEKSLTKESFTRIIKEAISKKQALGFVRAGIRGDSYGQTGHAMTLWGAEFDAEGYVSAIYYVDNNDHYTYDDSSDGSGRFQHHRCLRQVIVYHPESVWEVHFGTGGYNAVNSLTTVDLGRDIWQKAFPEVQPGDE